jgi:hypothetical protein
MRNIRQHLLCIVALACFAASSFGADKFLFLKGKDGPGKGKKIVLISGDEEYRSEEALPMLAKILSQHHGFDCVVLFSWSKDGKHIDPNNGKSLEGLSQLDDADLMICATRFRTPPADQMKSFDKFLDAGKPVIGMRTATHGFQGKWGFFGKGILGEKWSGHHGGHKRQGCRGVIEEANAKHPALNGVKDVFAPSDVYGAPNAMKGTTILLRGAVTETLDPASKPIAGKKNDPMQPLAWIRDYTSPGGGKGKAFCTTMGASVDLVGADSRRLIVNVSYHLLGLKVPAEAKVDFVDPYYPSFYGFIRDKSYWPGRDMQAEDYGLGKAPPAVDPKGTPNWPFRKMGPAK